MCLHTHHRTHAPKKHAKILQIFHMAKFFWQKMHFLEIFLIFAQSTWQKHACMELQSRFVQRGGGDPKNAFAKKIAIS